MLHQNESKRSGSEKCKRSSVYYVFLSLFFLRWATGEDSADGDRKLTKLQLNKHVLNRTMECAFSHVLGCFSGSFIVVDVFFGLIGRSSSIPLRAYLYFILAIVFFGGPFYLNTLSMNVEKKYAVQCFTFGNATQNGEEKTHNIRRTNCRRFSIQLLRLAPRTTIYLFSGYAQHSTAQNSPKAATYVFFCFAVFCSFRSLI